MATRLLIGTALAAALAAVVLAPLGGTATTALPVDPGCRANAVAPSDDGVGDGFALPFPVRLYGTTSSTLYVSTNGAIGLLPFANPSFAGGWITSMARTAGTPLIAPFAADADASGAAQPLVHYGLTTYEGRNAFCATWGEPNAGLAPCCGSNRDGNRFGVLIVDRSDRASGDVDVVFDYDRIAWDTPAYQGGTAAMVGFSAPTAGAGPSEAYAWPGSGQVGTLLDTGAGALVRGSRGSGVDGRYVFPILGGVPRRPGAVLAAAPPVPGLSGTDSVALADFDGDGKLDLLTANGGSGLVGVARGDGAGGFPTTLYRNAVALTSSPRVDVADLDGDGNEDIVVAGRDPNGSQAALTVLFGDGHGGFPMAKKLSATNESVGLHYLAVADVDGDGNPDVVVGRQTTIDVLLGDGHRGFQLRTSPRPGLAVAGTGFAVADVTGDGRPDALFSLTTGVAVLPGNGAGGFGAAATYLGRPPGSTSGGAVGLATADLNGDGRLDVVAGSASSTASLVVWLQQPDGTLGAPRFVAGGRLLGQSGDVAVADVDGDGTLDVVVGAPPDRLVHVFPGEGAGRFGPPTTVAISSAPASLATGDLDGDGRPDVVAGTVDVLLDRSDPTPPTVHVSDASAIATSATGAAVEYAATATDDVSGPVTPSCAPASGSTFPVGDTTVWCYAVDGAGNTGRASFTVHVTRAAPKLQDVPADIGLEGNRTGGALVVYEKPTATDPADPAPVIACLPASNTVFPLGVTTVACTATDTYGMQDSATFRVTVVDTTAPTLGAIRAVTVDATAPTGAVVSYAPPTARDVVDPAPAVRCAPASGARFAIGDTVVTCTATDGAGNAATTTFTVHVRGAGEQLAQLVADVAALRGKTVPPALLTLAEQALDRVSGKQPKLVCVSLSALDALVRAQSGKAITATQAQSIRADIARIEDVLAC